jgi:glycosyltransferase involved in cell wall biosynthesis
MNVEQPLVSVLITSYNYALYLREAIDSALNQTYSNTEVIVVDDGSTDNSPEIMASYEDRIIPIYKKNGGHASAANAAYAASQGQIICFLDSDDVWLPQKVETVVEAFNTYPNATVVYHKVQNIDTVGTPTGQPWPPYKPIKGDISQHVARTGGWWPFPPTTALSFSRTYMGKVMDIPEQGSKMCVDAFLADLAPFLGEVVGIDRVLSLYRIHGSNYWNDAAAEQQDVHLRRVLQDHELRVNRLNRDLALLGMDIKLSLAQHWPYQWLRYKHGVGQQENLISLSLLALQNPWEHRLLPKLKNVALLWLGRGKLSRI